MDEEERILDEIFSATKGKIFDAFKYMQLAYKKRVKFGQDNKGRADGFALSRAAFGAALKLSGLITLFDEVAETLASK